MEKHRAIPAHHMTVGEIAKKAGVTVRTLQYYDKQGLLHPASESEGGRRLYTDKELAKLCQILSMKYLGFSLEEIKAKLPSIDSPETAAAALEQQAAEIRHELKVLTETLEGIETLTAEIVQTQKVDWQRYADMMLLIRKKDLSFHVVKDFSDKVYQQVKGLDKKEAEGIRKAHALIFKRVAVLIKSGTAPESGEGQVLAGDFWGLIMDFTKGDMTLLPELAQLQNSHEESWQASMDYIEQAVDHYFKIQGIDPFN